MDFLNARTKNDLRGRLVSVAYKEADELLQKLKKLYPSQLAKLSVAFEDVPSSDMLKTGIKIESESHYNADKQELTLFLFNIYIKVENDAGDFRRRIREAILKVAGDIVGEDMEAGD